MGGAVCSELEFALHPRYVSVIIFGCMKPYTGETLQYKMRTFFYVVDVL